ncbi:9192_t:CDS:2 [Funneliformis geosporum]|uniref:9192_t:CDS:1 n=1 Tax=Funneliformis geosporum TaxID=1117311 RepID=A0A9W4SHY7_9GLOM|nr:9192_t:CDS:2 [Funneliformis geosporum]
MHSVIGYGAFSSVYAACLKHTQSKVAIKKFDEGSTEGIILNELKILERIREKPILTTNDRFVKLYQKCWQHEPNERPEINQVISELNSITHSEESVRIEEPGNDECLRTEELKNEEIKKSVEDCDTATHDKI